MKIIKLLLITSLSLLSYEVFADDIDIYLPSEAVSGSGDSSEAGNDASLTFLLDSSGSMQWKLDSTEPWPVVNRVANQRGSVMKYAFMDYVSSAANDLKVGVWNYEGMQKETKFLKDRISGKSSRFTFGDVEQTEVSRNTETITVVRTGTTTIIVTETVSVDAQTNIDNKGYYRSNNSGTSGFSWQNSNTYIGNESYWASSSPVRRAVFRSRLPVSADVTQPVRLFIDTGAWMWGVGLYFVEGDLNNTQMGSVLNNNSGIFVGTVNLNPLGQEYDVSSLVTGANPHWTPGNYGYFYLAKDTGYRSNVKINTKKSELRFSGFGIRDNEVITGTVTTETITTETVTYAERRSVEIPIQTIGSDVLQDGSGNVFDINDLGASPAVNDARLDSQEISSYYYDNANDDYRINNNGIPWLGYYEPTKLSLRPVMRFNYPSANDAFNSQITVETLYIRTDVGAVTDLDLYFFSDTGGIVESQSEDFAYNPSNMTYIDTVSLDSAGDATIDSNNNNVLKGLFQSESWNQGQSGFFVLVKDNLDYMSLSGLQQSYLRYSIASSGGTNLNLSNGNKVGLRFINVPVAKSTRLDKVELIVTPKNDVKPGNLTISLAEGAPSKLFKAGAGANSLNNTFASVSSVTISTQGLDWVENQPVSLTSDALTKMVQNLLEYSPDLDADDPTAQNKQWYFEAGIGFIIEGSANDNSIIYSFDEKPVSSLDTDYSKSARLRILVTNAEYETLQTDESQTQRGDILEYMASFGFPNGTPIAPNYADLATYILGSYNAYSSPIEARTGSSECTIPDSIVLLTDGEETTTDPVFGIISKFKAEPLSITSATTANANVTNYREECKPYPLGDGYNSYWGCSNQVAKNLADKNYELSTGVKSYAILFGPVSGSLAGDLNTFALNGGTNVAEQASSGSELIEIFNSIANDVTVSSASISAPSVSVDALNRARSSDQLFYGLFSPSDTAHWGGNLKRYTLQNLEVQGADLRNAVTSEEVASGQTSTVSVFRSGSFSWWSNDISNPDGGVVNAGGALGELQGLAERKVFTYIPDDTDFDSKNLKENQITLDNYPTALKPDDVSFMLDDTWGSVIHTSPSLVNQSLDDGLAINTIYVGDNAGYLHAIDGGGRTSDNSLENLQDPGGTELYAFVPSEFLENFSKLRADESLVSSDDYVYGIDGRITSFTYDDKNDGVYTTSDDELNLYFGLRRGGKSYYGLDIRSSYNRAQLRFWASPKDHVIKEPLPTYDEEADEDIRASVSDFDAVTLDFKVKSVITSSVSNITITIKDDAGTALNTCTWPRLSSGVEYSCTHPVNVSDVNSDITDLLLTNDGVRRDFFGVLDANIDGTAIKPIVMTSTVGVLKYTRADDLIVLECSDPERLNENCSRRVSDDNAAPKLLFRLTNMQGKPQPTGMTNKSYNALQRLGQTWSPMTPIYIKWNGKLKAVVVFGGGYDPEHNETGGKLKDPTVDSQTNAQLGNAVYIADANTGEILAWASSSLPLTDSGYNEDMKYSITGSLSYRDANGDAGQDMLYAADLGGNIFRIDLDPNAGKTQTATNERVGLITNVHTVAKLGVEDSEDPEQYRRFFEGPDVAFISSPKLDRDGDHMIAIGSGFRPDLKNSSVQDHMYVIYDLDAHRLGLQSVPRLTTISDLEDITNSVATPEEESNYHGWYIELDDSIGEKISGRPSIFSGIVTFVTYTNQSSIESAACVVDVGSSRSYAVNQDGSYYKDFGDDEDEDEDEDEDDASKRVVADGIVGVVDSGSVVITEFEGELEVVKVDGTTVTCLSCRPCELTNTCPPDDDCSLDNSCPEDSVTDLVPDYGAIIRGNWKQCLTSDNCGK